MPSASIIKKIPCSKEKLIQMVLDIEKYPEFVPWCLDGKIYSKNDKGDKIEIIADLTIGKSFFNETYKSFIIYNKSLDSIHVTNMEGPLKHLENKWFFKQNGVEIGSNCTIDRGSLSDTILEENTFLDNQIHIAHNVKIGKNCMIAGQVGIAGSSSIGDNVMIGGQAGISGHLKIGNNVKIGGNSGVVNDIKDNSNVMGYPAKSLREFVKLREKNEK